MLKWAKKRLGFGKDKRKKGQDLVLVQSPKILQSNPETPTAGAKGKIIYSDIRIQSDKDDGFVVHQVDVGPTIGKAASVASKYVLGTSALGGGSFATVWIGVEKTSGKQWAVKQIPRNVADENKALLVGEVSVMQSLDHPNLVKLHEAFETPEVFCMVQELLRGGELFDRIVEHGSFSEYMATVVLNMILSGLAYMHKKGYVHCDLKPENLMYASPEKDSAVKIIDFGFAQYVGHLGVKYMTRVLGTPEYIAPEVASGRGYCPANDLWSVGVISYVLLCGYFPFYGENVGEVFKAIKAGKFQFPSDEWDAVSPLAKDFVSRLLVVDPQKRMTAEEALKHPWMHAGAASQDSLPKSSFDQLRAFNIARRRLRKGGIAVYFTTVINTQRRLSIDPGGTGDGSGSRRGSYVPTPRVKEILENPKMVKRMLSVGEVALTITPPP